MKALSAAGRFLRAITTARDNETPSLLRVLALGITAEFLIWAAVAMTRGQEFDPRAFGEGAGLLVVAIGTALRISLPANAGNDGWKEAESILPESYLHADIPEK